jgi:hypothetical protein
MLKTISIIVISVAIFGIIFFIYVKKILKKRLDIFMSENRDKDLNN